MEERGRQRRPSPGARRFGYAVAVAVNALVLYLVNVQPGWDAVPFLTAGMEDVLPLLNASIIVSIVVNIAYLGYDSVRFRALGELVTTAFGFAVVIRFWQVFPFDVDDPWRVIFRILLGVGAVGSAIGILVSVGRVARGGTAVRGAP